jgi:hypothetical protein
VEQVKVVPIVSRGHHLREYFVYRGRDFRGFPPRAFTGY